MEPPPAATKFASHSTKHCLLSDGSSFHDPDVVELSAAAAAAWASTSSQQKRKRTQVAPHNVIEIDEDDDSAVVVIGESTANSKLKQVVGYDDNWQGFFTKGLISPAMYHGLENGTSLEALKASQPEYHYAGDIFNLTGSSMYHGIENSTALESLKASEPEYDYADDYEYAYDYENEEKYFDDIIDSYSKDNLAAKFDDLDLPPGVEATVTWLQNPAPANLNRKPKPILDDVIDIKFKQFKQFDIVQDYSDHHYVRPENVRTTSAAKKPPKNWAKKIQEEWKLLEKDLPETIFVRVYEERMDFLRAVIVGPAGTPYHDGLFFFDVFFPANYPNVAPLVYYHSGGLRLNPNLYKCGKVCLSLLGTWSGSGCEKWSPGKSTMLQVLVSIQALVLNAKPYFNEPGYANSANTPDGEKRSLAYNEEAFLLSCKTMLYSLRKPPKNFEDFVAGHFRHHGHIILVACRAYLEGAQVGCVAGDGVQDVDEGDKSCSSHFKANLGKLFEELLMEFTVKGADCDEFLVQKRKMGAAPVAMDTMLRL